MRAAFLLACLLLAGCTGPSDDLAASTTDAATGGSQPQDATSGMVIAIATALAPIYINGTLDSVGPCVLPDSQQPGELPAGQDLQPVPQAAWNRTYEGPSVSSADLNAAGACLVWLDDAGERIPEAPEGRVPAGTARVAVEGMAQLGASYSIKVA
ncbi:MAG: hypothetical protein QOD77_909 [Thermoplasmata archaeon]|jgi:hypothetical protein|nr:hypothetical protein [Thermoplasmata archaeon]